MSPLVTVDVWDTLLRRRCDPEAVKLFTCQMAPLVLAGRMRPTLTNPFRIYHLRRRIEAGLAAEARASGLDGEYLLEDVLARLCEALALPDTDPAERAEMSARLLRIEQAQERFVTMPDAGIRAVLDAHSPARIAFLTDFHWRAADVGQLLRHHGFADIAQDGLSSGEERLSKRSGRLFERAGARLGSPGSRWLHIGDDPVADDASARRAGLSSLLYRPADEEARRLAKARLMANAAAVLEQARDRREAVSAAEEAGREAAPLFAGFGLWLVERAVATRASRVHFFMREGRFLRQAYDAAAEAYREVLDPPPSSELFVSRLATFGASLGASPDAALKDVWAFHAPIRAGALLETLGLVMADHLASYRAAGLDPDEVLAAPSQDARAAALLAMAPVRRAITDRGADQRALLLRYLAAQGLEVGGRAMVVDIGWRGSIADNLARLMPQVAFDGCYLGLERRKATLPNSHKAAYAVDLELSRADADLVSYVAPIEFLTAAPVGSVIGYEEDDAGRVRPVMRLRAPSPHDEAVAAFQQACLAEVARLCQASRVHALGSREWLGAAVSAWRDLIRRPRPALAQAFLGTRFDESFGQARHDRPGAAGKERGGVPASLGLADRLRRFVRTTPWPHALRRAGHGSGDESGGFFGAGLPLAVQALRKADRLRRGHWLPSFASSSRLSALTDRLLLIARLRLERGLRSLRARLRP
jgi:FMN phosphatase YigB (HAD superfamily)